MTQQLGIHWANFCQNRVHDEFRPLPCSTLDPVLRMEQQGVTPQGLAIILAVLAYLFAKPGDIAASTQ